MPSCEFTCKIAIHSLNFKQKHIRLLCHLPRPCESENLMNQPAFSYIPLASEITDPNIVDQVKRKFADALATLNGRSLAMEALDPERPLVLLVISGGTEALIVDCVAKRHAAYGREPVLLLAHPGNNSLAASLEALARLRQMDIKGEIIFFPQAADRSALSGLADRVKDMAVLRRLQQSRVGLIGKPSEWLVASTTDDRTFQTTWGIRIIHYSLAQVFAPLTERTIPAKGSGNVMAGFTGSGAYDQASRVYELLDQLARDEQLDALSVECFSLFHHFQTHGCLALARLNDAGIMAGCEGDLVSTLGLLWIKFLLGQNSWMANPVEVNQSTHTLWLAHCTVPTSMVETVSEATHFETGCGVAVSGRFANGPVTLLRIGGTALDKIWLAEAEITATDTNPHRCRTQALVQFKDASPLQELLHHPLGNHLILTRGAHARRLYGWWKMFIST